MTSSLSSRFTAMFMALLLPLLAGAASPCAPPDSMIKSKDDVSRLPASLSSIGAGAAMLGVGALSRQLYPHDFTVPSIDRHSSRGMGVVQYAPFVAPWVLKAAGVPTRSDWSRMAVSQSFATALMIGSVSGLKHSVHSTRPDGSDNRSFPSGHTAWAFLGATMMARELGGTSPWYAVGAYTVATAVAVERAVDLHHYPTDVMAGAGIGILSAQIGYLIGDLWFGSDNLRLSRSELGLDNNLSYLSLSTGLSLPLGSIRAGDTKIQRLPALSASLRGGWAASDHWGLAVELGLLSTPLITDVRHDRTYVKSLSSLSAVISPYYICSLSRLVSFTAEAGAGYRHNFKLNLDDNAVETGSGSPVGRISAGCVLRFGPHFSAKASVGYEMSRYRYTVRPSTAYHIPEAASARGVSSSLLLNLSSRYEF